MTEPRGGEDRPEVEVVAPDHLRAPLRLLEAELREGEPLPQEIVDSIVAEVRSGAADVLAAYDPDSGEPLGAALVCYRLNLASGGRFASFEELHVAPESRGRGVGKALLSEVERRCSQKGISYVEAQIIAESVPFFLSLGYEPEQDLRVLFRSIPFSH